MIVPVIQFSFAMQWEECGVCHLWFLPDDPEYLKCRCSSTEVEELKQHKMAEVDKYHCMHCNGLKAHTHNYKYGEGYYTCLWCNQELKYTYNNRLKHPRVCNRKKVGRRCLCYV